MVVDLWNPLPPEKNDCDSIDVFGYDHNANVARMVVIVFFFVSQVSYYACYLCATTKKFLE